MGVSVRATVFFGAALNGRSLHTKRTERAFKHDYPADWLVDPKTGAPLWREVSDPIDGYDEEGGTLFGYELREAEGELYACLRKACVGMRDHSASIKPVPLPSQADIDTFKQKL